MPKISEFFGIIISMFYDDHNPPHFHAIYGERKAIFSIADLRMVEGELPSRAISLVLEWALLHRDELAKEWELASSHKPLFWIKPLE
jgi:hypothetical protein